MTTDGAVSHFNRHSIFHASKTAFTATAVRNWREWSR